MLNEDIFIHKHKRKQEIIQDAIHNAKGYKQAVLLVGSFGKSKQDVSAKVNYISQGDDTPIKDKEGEFITLDQAKENTKQWVDDTKKRKGVTRYTMNLTLQSIPNADPISAERAFFQFLSNEFTDNDYIYAVHLDTDSPHAHAIVKMQSNRGKKIQATKPDLYKWRENFAQVMREHGFQLSATSRQSRGKVGSSPKMGTRIKANMYDKALNPSYERKHDKNNIEEWGKFYNEIGQQMAVSNNNNVKHMGRDLIAFSSELGKDKQVTR